MGLDVSIAMFENMGMLKNTARYILNNSGASVENVSNILDKSLFSNESYKSSVDPQMAIIKASTQISLNSTLNETLKYLKAHAHNKNVKKPVFGELWSVIETNNQDAESEDYRGELIDFQIDKHKKNIFAA